MNRQFIKKEINFTDEELFQIFESSESLSEISRILFNSDVYGCREAVKKIIKEKNLPYPHKKEKHYFCLCCGKEITDKDKKRKKFCSHSCSASYNNRGVCRNKTSDVRHCPICGKKLKGNQKYCSKECRKLYLQRKAVESWKNGTLKGYSKDGSIKAFLRRYLLEKNNNACEICGFNEINPYTNNSILQIHHKDGNCFNDDETNLQVLCPNHHAMTENYGSRNKNSKRIDRRTKYYKDKTRKCDPNNNI